MSNQSRRDFFKYAGLGVAAGTMAAGASSCASSAKVKKEVLFQLGMASYTFREFDLDQTLAMTNRLAVKNIALKSFHLPLNASPELINEAVAKVKAAGINLYGGGVIYMKNEQEVAQAFEYAKMAGISTIVGVPNHELLGLVDQKIKEYDIMVAIHNHGPGDELYPSPASIYEKIKDMDARFGLCMDIGHTVRIGLDPSEEAVKYFDRLLDVHVKDVNEASGDGYTVEVGRGVINVPAFLNTLIDLGYDRYVSLEFEKDGNDPLPGCAESIGYINGVLAVI